MNKKNIWEGVNPTLKEKMEQVLKECLDAGYLFVPYFGLRTLRQQNLLYRQSRPTSTIDTKIKELRDAGAPYLADQLEKAPRTTASHVTNSVGGLSWHNWGEAMDCFLAVGKRAIWTDHPGYEAFGEAVMRNGLKWGGTFKSFKDPGHAQLRMEEPLDLYSYVEINEHFQSLGAE